MLSRNTILDYLSSFNEVPYSQSQYNLVFIESPHRRMGFEIHVAGPFHIYMREERVEFGDKSWMLECISPQLWHTHSAFVEDTNVWQM